MSSIAIDAERLRVEIARRGWDAADLAREARLSAATVSAAMSGRAISAKSLALIATALLRKPPIEMIDSLIVADGKRHLGLA